MGEFVKKLTTTNLLIVDALNLCMRWKPYKPGDPVKPFADEFVATIRSLARSYDCGQIIVTADQQGSTYRKELLPSYKANRKELAESQTPEQKKQTQRFFSEYEKALELADASYLVLRYPGVEADDIAAYIVSRRVDYGFDDIWLISSDRDWDLLIGEHVSRFSTVTRKEQTLETWDYEVTPEQYISYKCLIGDKGDNVPGVPGVGPVRAKALIDQFGSALDIAEQIPLPGKYKYIQAVNDSRDQILLNHELMDLVTYCQDAIGDANIKDIGRRLIFNDKFESDWNH